MTKDLTKTVYWPVRESLPLSGVGLQVTISTSTVDGAPVVCLMGRELDRVRVLLVPDDGDPIRLRPMWASLKHGHKVFKRFSLSPGRVPGCPTCEANPTGIMPPHYASKRCESGGRNHCTCKACFD